MLVHNDAARWTGRKNKSIEILVPLNAVLMFVGQMRYKPRPEARGLDSKTHARERLVFRHVRNDAYADCVGRIGVVEEQYVETNSH